VLVQKCFWSASFKLLSLIYFGASFEQFKLELMKYLTALSAWLTINSKQLQLAFKMLSHLQAPYNRNLLPESQLPSHFIPDILFSIGVSSMHHWWNTSKNRSELPCTMTGWNTYKIALQTFVWNICFTFIIIIKRKKSKMSIHDPSQQWCINETNTSPLNTLNWKLPRRYRVQSRQSFL
jgi:hypothetical protein